MILPINPLSLSAKRTRRLQPAKAHRALGALESSPLWRLAIASILVFVVVITTASTRAARTTTSDSVWSASNFVDAETRAAEWRITIDEWVRYQDLMSGARGVWTPDADPLLALGAHAETDSERRRYAELYVQRESERVEGELAFQRAVTAAWQRLYPNQPRVGLPARAPTVAQQLAAEPPDRYALVLGPDCSDCPKVLQRYLDRVSGNAALGPLDLFVRTTDPNDERLREWVAEAGVPVELIQRGLVTINHGDEYQGALPQVWGRLSPGRWSQLQ